MTETVSIVTQSLAALTGLAMVTMAALAGWRGWLDLQRTTLTIEQHAIAPAEPTAGARIELADLRERVRKLEAIAAGIDL
ncbi:hypothetical protein [Sphingomonas abietis]|uniref:Uncharacterized protein n=1 Tax=Sphingomonas abietis TaxID=3012344 RepID=A0ABY7NLJ3_9SPHN|nr:hypothetical protein [Sphingomonas abietis]WBO21442.1 hypothetical protein PBT88_14785 [Sphingomonas abietis]